MRKTWNARCTASKRWHWRALLRANWLLNGMDKIRIGKGDSHLVKLRNASQAAWEDMKAGMDAAMHDLEVAYKQADAHFK